MTAHKLTIGLRRNLHRSAPVQIGLIFGFWMAGEALVRVAGVPLPGGLVGMAIVLVLLASHRISLFSMRKGANWFLAEMLLFFVPAVLAVTNHHELFGLLGLKVLVVIVAGTLAVMSVTALTVELCYRWTSRHGSSGTHA